MDKENFVTVVRFIVTNFYSALALFLVSGFYNIQASSAGGFWRNTEFLQKMSKILNCSKIPLAQLEKVRLKFEQIPSYNSWKLMRLSFMVMIFLSFASWKKRGLDVRCSCQSCRKRRHSTNYSCPRKDQSSYIPSRRPQTLAHQGGRSEGRCEALRTTCCQILARHTHVQPVKKLARSTEYLPKTRKIAAQISRYFSRIHGQQTDACRQREERV